MIEDLKLAVNDKYRDEIIENEMENQLKAGFYNSNSPGKKLRQQNNSKNMYLRLDGNEQEEQDEEERKHQFMDDLILKNNFASAINRPSGGI